MFSEIAIKVENLSKCYHIYDTPRDRLKQFIFPRVQRIFANHPRQYYREFWALKDISFEVKKGETIGIVGRNGSGKSTLLQMICGTLNPTSGNIITKGRIAALLELGSGFNPEFSGRENVYLNGAVLGLSNAEIDRRFEAIAAFADIGEFIEQPVKSYSSGMMLRLAFSVAINVEPEVLIVDEALSVGDELFQRKCFARIEAIRASGTTILFVSHSGAQIVELCDRAMLIDAGEKLMVGPPKQIVGRYQKLLYAPPEKRLIVREQIQRAKERIEEASDITGRGAQPIEQPCDFILEKEAFDISLNPSSTVRYESNGAVIEGLGLYTLAGERVNNLIRGRSYRYVYSVSFDQLATFVRFGMSVRTISGLPIGGAFSAATMKDAIPQVDAGENLQVEFTFNSYLNPGVYFLNAGVYSLHEGEEKIMHRIVDAVAFRILPSSVDGSTGTTWLSITANVF